MRRFEWGDFFGLMLLVVFVMLFGFYLGYHEGVVYGCESWIHHIAQEGICQ